MKDRDGKDLKKGDVVKIHNKQFAYSQSTVSYLDEDTNKVGIFTGYGPCEFPPSEISLKEPYENIRT